MPTLSLRVSSDEDKLLRSYADVKGISLNDLLKNAAIEKIEDEIDLETYNKALEEFEKNPVTYSHEEVMKELGFSE